MTFQAFGFHSVVAGIIHGHDHLMTSLNRKIYPCLDIRAIKPESQGMLKRLFPASCVVSGLSHFYILCRPRFVLRKLFIALRNLENNTSILLIISFPNFLFFEDTPTSTMGKAK